MLKNLIDPFLYYTQHFEFIDYLAFSWLFILCFLFIVLGFMLVKNHLRVSIFIITCTIFVLIFAPFAIQLYLENSLRKTQVAIENINISQNIFISGKIKNLSKNDFSTCRLFIKLYKSKNDFFPFVQLHKDSKQNIAKDKEILFSYHLTDTKEAQDIKVQAQCYK